MNYDVAVIGGGITGMMTAWELARENQKVVLIDSQETGRACSWAGGGILSPLRPWRQNPANLALSEWSAARYPDLCEQLCEETGIDPEYNRCGMLFLDFEDEGDIRDWADTHKESCQWIPAGEQIDFSRDWFPRSKPSLWVPGIAQARNPRLLRALKAMLLKLSVQIHEHCPVYELDLRSDTQSVTCLSNIEPIRAGHVVIAAGVWCNDLLPDSGKLDLVPMRGQMLCITDHQIELDHMVINKDCYLIPRRSDALLIGSTVENVGFDNSVTQTAREHFLQSAGKLIAEIGGSGTIHHWSGLRPKSANGRPYLGPLPLHNRLLVNTGHYRTGLLTAPASARIISDHILKRESEFDTAAYMPPQY